MTPDFALAYSNPFEGFCARSHRAWGSIVLASRVEAFLDRWEGTLTQAAPDALAELRGLNAALVRQADASDGSVEEDYDPFEAAWHPFAAPAPLKAADAGCPQAALARTAQLVLRLAAFKPLEAAVAIGAGVSLGFDRYLLPPLDRIAASSDGRVCVIRGERDGTARMLRFVRNGDGWRAASAAGAVEQPGVRIGGSRILVYPLVTSDVSPSERIEARAEALQALIGAIGLIEAFPAFAGWVGRTLRVIAPLETVPGCYNSESFAALPGAMFVSLHPDPIRTAETLVHEASHDHLHLLMAVDPLADRGGEESFFSPPKRCMRPTIGILKAHHAFANVLCFYYLLQSAGVRLDSGYARGVGELEAWHDHFAACLDRSQTLTPVGQALWRPAARRVAQLAALSRHVGA